MKPPHYQRWRDMMSRCYNKKCRIYKYYGARGIRVCKAWHEFKVFQQWCMDNYVDKYVLDKINNFKSYSPGNCRFVSKSDSIKNRRMTSKRRAACKHSGHEVNKIRADIQRESAAAIKVLGKKKCNTCVRLRLLKFMTRKTETLSGYASICKECDSKKHRERTLRNKFSHNLVGLKQGE